MDEVANAIINVIDRPRREVDLPWYMGVSSKIYGMAPGTIEKLGKNFFDKK